MTEVSVTQQNKITTILHGTSPGEVREVVDRLDALQDVMDGFNNRLHNPAASFNRLYRVITDQVDQGLTTGRFADPLFMKTLDLRFADRYFDAVKQWNDKSLTAPRCWSALLAKVNDRDLAPILGAVAGVTAHICFDLPAALVRTFKDVGGSIPESSAQRVADYKVLNEIFAERIPSLRRGMLDGNLIADLFDKLTGNLDDLMQAETVTAARQFAWDRAAELWSLWDDPDRYTAKLRSFDGWAQAAIDSLFIALDNPIGNYLLRDADPTGKAGDGDGDG